MCQHHPQPNDSSRTQLVKTLSSQIITINTSVVWSSLGLYMYGHKNRTVVNCSGSWCGWTKTIISEKDTLYGRLPFRFTNSSTTQNKSLLRINGIPLQGVLD